MLFQFEPSKSDVHLKYVKVNSSVEKTSKIG